MEILDNVFENENTEDITFSNTLHNFKNYLCKNLLVKIDRQVWLIYIFFR